MKLHGLECIKGPLNAYLHKLPIRKLSLYAIKTYCGMWKRCSMIVVWSQFSMNWFTLFILFYTKDMFSYIIKNRMGEDGAPPFLRLIMTRHASLSINFYQIMLNQYLFPFVLTSLLPQSAMRQQFWAFRFTFSGLCRSGTNYHILKLKMGPDYWLFVLCQILWQGIVSVQWWSLIRSTVTNIFTLQKLYF